MAIAIPPYFINSPLPTGVVPNLLFGDVWQGTLNIPVATVSNGLITLVQDGYTFGTRVTDPTLRFSRFAYTAGVTGIYTLNFSAITPVVGKIYTLSIYGGAPTYPYSYSIQVIAATTSTSDFATLVNNTLTSALQSAFFTNTVSGSTVTLNEVNTQTGGFTVVFQGDVNFVFGTTTADVQPVGTLAQVQAAFPNKGITTGTFNLYQWKYQVLIPNIQGSGQNDTWEEYIQIYIDRAATNYAAADTLMTQIGGLTQNYFTQNYSALIMTNTFGVPS